MRLLRLFLAAGLLACLTPRTASAQQGVHTHDGFFLRMATGVGYHYARFNGLGGGDLSLKGFAFPTSLAIGWSVVEDLALQLEVFDSTGFQLSASYPERALGEDHNDAGSTGLGVGVTYYFGPNLYVSGSLGAALGNYLEGDQAEFSELGLGVGLAGGKEWWVSDNWGLGGALQLMLNATPTSLQGNPTLLSLGTGLMISATYN